MTELKRLRAETDRELEEIVPRRKGMETQKKLGRKARQEKREAKGLPIRSYRYRIYPTPEQEEHFLRYFEVLTGAWNVAVRYGEDLRKETGKYPTKKELFEKFNEYRSRTPAVRALYAQTANHMFQVTLPDAYSRAFDRLKKGLRAGEDAGFPKVKKTPIRSIRFPTIWNQGRRFIPTVQPEPIDIGRQKWKKRRTTIRLPKEFGDVEIVLHRPFPMPSAPEGYPRGRPTGLAITRGSDGTWHAVYSCEVERDDFTEGLIALKYAPTGVEVGMDAGISPAFAILSDGTKIEAKKFYRDQQKKLRKLQREVDRRTNYVVVAGKRYRAKEQSVRQQKSAAKLNKLHAKIARQRRDDHFKVASQFAQQYDVVYHETLNIKGMTTAPKKSEDGVRKNRRQKAGTNKGMVDCGFGQFFEILADKMKQVGKDAVGVEAAYTSKDCHSCGARNDAKIGRLYRCGSCGIVMDRDVNAAKNILARGRDSKKARKGS